MGQAHFPPHICTSDVQRDTCSSHSSLDVVGALPQSPPHFSDSHHFVQCSHSIPSTPTAPFNARKASTQCRAIQGYVSLLVVISTVPTAKAFGIPLTLQGLYNKFMDRALAVDLKSAYWQGGGFAFFFFVVYAAYGLGQSFIFFLIFLSHSFPYSL